MGEAFLVNPYDEERTAEAVEAALDLPADERRERMAALHRRVSRNNVFAWSERFLASLARGERAARGRTPASSRPRLPRARSCWRPSGARAAGVLLSSTTTARSCRFAARPARGRASAAARSTCSRRLAEPPDTTVVPALRPLARRPRPLVRRRRPACGSPPSTAPCCGRRAARVASDCGPTRTGRLEGPRPARARALRRPHAGQLHRGEGVTRSSGTTGSPTPSSATGSPTSWSHNLEQLLAETELRAMRGHKAVEVRPAWAQQGRGGRLAGGRRRPAPTSAWRWATTAPTRTSSRACRGRLDGARRAGARRAPASAPGTPGRSAARPRRVLEAMEQVPQPAGRAAARRERAPGLYGPGPLRQELRHLHGHERVAQDQARTAAPSTDRSCASSTTVIVRESGVAGEGGALAEDSGGRAPPCVLRGAPPDRALPEHVQPVARLARGGRRRRPSRRSRRRPRRPPRPGRPSAEAGEEAHAAQRVHGRRSGPRLGPRTSPR